MKLLSRTLKAQGGLWALLGLVLLVKPGLVVEQVLGLPPAPETALLRVLGVASVVLAMLMVLVAQHVDETWWWAWAFALLEAGVASVCLLHVLLGAGESAPSLPWWVAGLVSVMFGALDLAGMGRAGQEKPIV